MGLKDLVGRGELHEALVLETIAGWGSGSPHRWRVFRPS